jgi:hypothetical protein
LRHGLWISNLFKIKRKNVIETANSEADQLMKKLKKAKVKGDAEYIGCGQD